MQTFWVSSWSRNGKPKLKQSDHVIISGSIVPWKRNPFCCRSFPHHRSYGFQLPLHWLAQCPSTWKWLGSWEMITQLIFQFKHIWQDKDGCCDFGGSKLHSNRMMCSKRKSAKAEYMHKNTVVGSFWPDLASPWPRTSNARISYVLEEYAFDSGVLRVDLAMGQADTLKY